MTAIISGLSLLNHIYRIYCEVTKAFLVDVTCASKVITFLVDVTFCVSLYISWFNTISRTLTKTIESDVL